MRSVVLGCGLIALAVTAWGCGAGSENPSPSPAGGASHGGASHGGAGTAAAAGSGGSLIASAGSAHAGSGSAGGSVQPAGGAGGSAGTPSSGGSSAAAASTAGSNSAGASGAGTAGSSSTGGTGGVAGAAGQATCTPPMLGSMGKNPLFSDQYTADPAPMIDKCTFYITCGHDEGSSGFLLREWFLLSSTDMVIWTKRVALSLKDFKWADANAWAGQMVTKSGKYYWYVPMNEAGSGMAIGVAVADSASGTFKDALGKSLVDDAFEISNMGFANPSATPYTIDPSVFADDDGQAYLHYGGFGRMIVAKLNDDMISINGKMKEVTPQGFFEAAFLSKRNGVYYEIYAAGQNPATIDYATASSPLGPWKYGGRILDALPNVSGQDAATSHPGVAQFQGQWYLVYHLSNGPNNGGTYRRQVAIDKLTFNADGSIQKLVRSSGLSF